MSLLHDGYNFNSPPIHDPIVQPESPELQIVESVFAGVKGAAHLIGETGPNDLFCLAIYHNYNTKALLKADIDEIRGKVGKLRGTLTEVIAGSTLTYPQCTFMGITEIPPRGGTHSGAFFDGSGVHGWTQYTILRWRKRGG